MKATLTLVILGLVALVVPNHSAYATTAYGNPTGATKAGALSFGFSLVQVERETEQEVAIATDVAGSATLEETDDTELSYSALLVSYGVSDTASIDLSAGDLELEDDDGATFDGVGIGLGFRLNGLIATAQYGDLEGDDFTGTVTQFDLGYGLSTTVAQNGAVYGILLFSKLMAEFDATQAAKDELSAELTAFFGTPVTVTSVTNEYEEDQPMLIVVGGEFNPTSNVSAGVELHLAGETGIGVRVIASL